MKIRYWLTFLSLALAPLVAQKPTVPTEITDVKERTEVARVIIDNLRAQWWLAVVRGNEQINRKDLLEAEQRAAQAGIVMRSVMDKMRKVHNAELDCNLDSSLAWQCPKPENVPKPEAAK